MTCSVVLLALKPSKFVQKWNLFLRVSQNCVFGHIDQICGNMICNRWSSNGGSKGFLAACVCNPPNAKEGCSACFIFLQLLEELTENEFRERWWKKTADQKTIFDYHVYGQTGKTFINYHEEFEHAQSE